MLSLGRNPGQYVVIDNKIIVQVLYVKGTLRLAIEAPRDIEIERGEIYEQSHEIPEVIKRNTQI